MESDVLDQAAKAIEQTLAVNAARQRGGRVVAVSTTVARALETASQPDGTVTPGVIAPNCISTLVISFARWMHC